MDDYEWATNYVKEHGFFAPKLGEKAIKGFLRISGFLERFTTMKQIRSYYVCLQPASISLSIFFKISLSDLPQPFGGACRNSVSHLTIFLKEDTDTQKQAEKEDVAGGGSEHLIEGLPVQGLQLSEGAEVQDQVDEHEGVAYGGIGVEEQGGEGEKCGENAQPEVDVEGVLLPLQAAFLSAVTPYS